VAAEGFRKNPVYGTKHTVWVVRVGREVAHNVRWWELMFAVLWRGTGSMKRECRDET